MVEYYMFRQEGQLFHDLYLCYCGYESCPPLYSFGPAVRPNYLLHVIMDGKGIFRTGDDFWELGAGDGFLIKPEAQTFYRADRHHPWSYIWVGFDGRIAPSLCERLGLSGGQLTFHTGRGSELREIVMEMLKVRTYSAERDFYLEELLYRFFATMLKDMDPTSPSRLRNRNDYVREAENYIGNHFHEHIRIDEIADYVGVNRSYLYTLFMKKTGAGPQEYLRNFRLSRAADMLGRTTCQIEVVARSCGFNDPRAFSKLFKARFKETPSAYRRREQKKVSE